MPGSLRRVATRMSRLATVRSRRMMLVTVCSAAVMLGAIGKTMIDGLSAPNINLSTSMVGDTALPALPAPPAPSVASHRASVSPPAMSATPAASVTSAASATKSISSATIISHPPANERSLPDTRRNPPCSAHSRSSCVRYSEKRAAHSTHAAHSSHATRTSHSTRQPVQQAQTAHAAVAPAIQTEPATWTPVHAASSSSASPRSHEERGKSAKILESARQNEHH